MTDYRLSTEGGRYTVRGGSSRATLGAPYTGRNVDVESAYALARPWLEACTTEDLEHPEFDDRFRTMLTQASPMPFSEPLFRGRTMPSRPESSQFGPDPSASRQRYNWKETPALYLSNSEMGVVNECPAIPPGEDLWIQQYELPANVELFDARELEPTSFHAGVFWVIEQQRVRGREHPALGARVAELVSTSFDGMIVPGVRGDPKQLYCNIVIFRPTQCKTWLHKSEPWMSNLQTR